MSYGIVRVKKIKGGSAIAGLEIHNERKRDVSHSNPDIDFSKTDENYKLATCKVSYNIAIDERLRQGYTGTKEIRKDAVKMCETIFTASPDFFKNNPNPMKIYFEDCFTWAEKRWGCDNIISAVVHLDEATPHMHLDFVPLTKEGKLSAKSVLGGRQDLQKLQDDFYNQVGINYGLERGSRVDLADLDAEKPRKNLPTVAFKEKQKLLKDIEVLKQQEKTVTEEVRAFEVGLEGGVATRKELVMQLSEYKPKRGVFGSKEYYEIPAPVFEDLQNKLISKAMNTAYANKRKAQAEEKEQENEKKEQELKALESKASYEMSQARRLFKEQADLNNLYKQQSKELSAVRQENTSLRADIYTLNQEVKQKDNQIEVAENETAQAVKSLRDTVKAVNMLAHDDGDYKVDLTKKQIGLIEGIEKRAIKVMKSLGFRQSAEDVEKNIGVDDSILKEMKPQKDLSMER